MNINIPKIKFQNVIETLKTHIILIWSILSAILLIWAGYIFYFKSYIPTYTTLLPIVRTQTVQKSKLEATLRDISEKGRITNEFSREKIVNPFEFRQ